MEQTKSLVESRTFWGALISIVASGIAGLHYTVTPADQASLLDAIMNIVSGVSALYAIYGRIIATHKIV